MSQTDRVHAALHADLTRGRWRPGEPISVKDIAERLSVSPTPVREALERLVGQGLVSPATGRNGFVIPRMGTRGFTSLTETFCLLVEAVLREGRVYVLESVPIDVSDPVGTTDAIFDPVLSPQNAAAWTARRLSSMLSAYRTVEPDIIEDWADHMSNLRIAITEGNARSAIRDYSKVRVMYAHTIIDHFEEGMSI